MQDSRLFNLVLCKWILVKICSELQGWQDERLASSPPPAASYTSIYPFIMHQLCVLFSYIKRNAWPCLNILEQTFGICLFGLFFFSVRMKIKRRREGFEYCVIIVCRRVHKIFRLMRLLPGTLRGSLLACLASEYHVNNLIWTTAVNSVLTLSRRRRHWLTEPREQPESGKRSSTTREYMSHIPRRLEILI